MTQRNLQPVQRERNWAVYILFFLAVIAGILAFVDAARYMGWLPIATFGELKFVLPDARWFAALMSALVGVIWFVVAKWLWDLNPSGWLFVVVIAVINLIFLFLSILGKTTFSDVLIPVIVNVLALILALLPSTKQAFIPPLPSKDAVQDAADRTAAARTASVAATADKVADKATDATATTGAAVADAADDTADAVTESAAAIAAAAEAVDAAPGVDLTQIEGVGPKIAEVLRAAGINSYAELAATSPEELHKILADAGISAKPDTWPSQAQLAAAGRWKDLEAIQAQLKGGRTA
ncbi:MAG: DUF4332 domain-containing protein [Chloroflexota bacterium]|nr:DUF4332 domain-containing protein [Chloroflexota bacterium]